MTPVILYAIAAIFAMVFGGTLLVLNDGQRGLNIFLSAGCLVVLMFALWRISVILGLPT